MPRKKTPRSKQETTTEAFKHPEAKLLIRPEIGAQARFRKKKPPQKYRYDDSLDPEMQWDEKNPARELGEWLLAQVDEASRLDPPHQFSEPRQFGENSPKVYGLTDAVRELQAISRPFLNWAGKAERTSFAVPTLPLFVHERLSTKAILETLKSHRRDKQESFLADLFADPQLSLTDQLTKAYEYPEPYGWKNRMVLGDSLVAMNSLLRYEGLGGQVQMIYIDPPYGVKFGSNFQPFVRKRDVSHGADEDMTREPEMVQAYRDTWELGLHSYLTYLRDRLYVSKDLLSPTGSVFVQISDENLHHAREVMDEVFGKENFVSQISFQTTTGFETKTIATLGDFLLWYAKDCLKLKVRKVFRPKSLEPGDTGASWLLLSDGTYRGVSAAEARGEVPLPVGARLYKPDNLLGQGASREPQPFEFEGKVYEPPANAHWKANYPAGMQKLAKAGRIHVARNSIQYRRFAVDFAFSEIGNLWTDTLMGSFLEDKVYVVQTNPKVIERCLLMTTEPGDLVLDPTCGSGTTAYIAEQWGRRWVTIDTSRVPLALARQRLITATFPFYGLKDQARGPAGGFIYLRKQNKKGEEVGGIVPHVTLGSIANDESAKEELLVDRPEVVGDITRVTGPFVLEGTIPTASSPEDSETGRDTDKELAQTYHERMIETLRRAPVLRLQGNQTVTLKNIRPPAKTLTIAAEANVEALAPRQAATLDDLGTQIDEQTRHELPLTERPVAIVFGPENGPVTERLVREAHDEASMKSRGYTHLYVIGFAVQPSARAYIEAAGQLGIPATYLSASMDLQMGDLLKHMRSSQIFSVVGQPDVKVRKLDDGRYQADVSGLDTFDPATMEALHLAGEDLPAWFLDTDYNGLCFHVSQAFFPRTKAWDSIKRAVGVDFEPTVWEHLAGTTSAPFEAGEQKQIAVKVIDDRGNELLVVKNLEVK